MGWAWEVTKMFMYISFPVGIYHYFNQPENYEEWVIKEKQKYFPPESKAMNKQMEDFIREFNLEMEKRHLEKLEMQENNKKKH